MLRPKVIAFYLPQFHPIKENNEWYGEGFTEWTNVGKAKPLFKSHYQPHVPADLGYYDLRLPEVREKQAELAKEARIDAFCYYHYWFGNGKVIMEMPLQEVVKSAKPDFPFMVCWANHSFYNKSWNIDAKKLDQNLLLEQTYPDEKDIVNHFNFLLPAFKDKRYFRIDDKLAFVIYDFLSFPDDFFDHFKSLWNNMAKEHGLPEFFFMGYTSFPQRIEKGLFSKLDAVIFTPTDNAFRKGKLIGYNKNGLKERIKNKIFRTFKFTTNIKDYKKSLKYLIHSIEKRDTVFPVLIPNWDTTPRRSYGANIFINSTPEIFKRHIKDVLNIIKHKPENRQIIFIRSWNEWGEGNYIEPDLKYGKGYIESLGSVLNKK